MRKKTDENLTTNKNKSKGRSVSRDSSTHLTQTRPQEREKEREIRGEKRTHTLTHPIQFEADEEAGGSGRLCTQGERRAGGGQQSGSPEWTLDTRSLWRLPGDTHALLLAFVWSPDELSLILMFPRIMSTQLPSLSPSPSLPFLLRYGSINMTSCIGGVLSSFFPRRTPHVTLRIYYLPLLFVPLICCFIINLQSLLSRSPLLNVSQDSSPHCVLVPCSLGQD